MSSYATALATRLDVPEVEVSRLRRAALVHDLGKLAVPNSILEKAGSLDEDEWGSIRRHPGITYDILLRTPGFAELAMDAANHHERIDGTGYHRGLGGSDLSLSARILAVSDVMDALAADRPYRGGMKPEAVLSIIEEGSGSHFCSMCVDACTTDLVANAGETPVPHVTKRTAREADPPVPSRAPVASPS